MKTRVVWDCIYPNPECISRQKYYNYEVNGNTVVIFADGRNYNCTKDQFLEFFRAESGILDLGTKIEKKIEVPTDK